MRRSLQTWDAKEGPKPWWSAKIQFQYAQELNLGVGRNFNFVVGDYLVGQYCIVGLAQAPEGYVVLVAVGNSCVANQVPTITDKMLVKET